MRVGFAAWLMAAAGMFQSNACHALKDVGYLLRRENNVAMHIVQVDLNKAQVRVTGAIAKNGVGTSESVSSFASRVKPTAMITGTFFGTENLLPIADLVIGRLPIYRGNSIGTAFGMTADGRALFSRQFNHKWSQFETLFCGGIELIKKGRVSVNPTGQGFKDPALFARKRRTAIALTKQNKLLLIATNQEVYLSELAKAIKKLGAVEAVSLDGGSSTTLYYRGSWIAKPSRPLTNMLVVYEDSSTFRKQMAQLAPGVARHKGMLLAEATHAAAKKQMQTLAAKPAPPKVVKNGFAPPVAFRLPAILMPALLVSTMIALRRRLRFSDRWIGEERKPLAQKPKQRD